MVARYGMSTCPTQTTPNGGRHYIFKYDADRMSDMKAIIKGASINGRPVGIDLWIQRCQFVAEPSVNYNNGIGYKWIKPLTRSCNIPCLPEWIYDLYHSGEITEDGCILPQSERGEEAAPSDELRACISETRAFGHQPTHTDSIYSTANSSDYGNSIDLNSLSWVGIVLITVVALLMLAVALFAWITAMLMLLTVPASARRSFVSYFKKMLDKAIQTAED
jgi:hypothetical protein